jgi:hypothetical protein
MYCGGTVLLPLYMYKYRTSYSYKSKVRSSFRQSTCTVLVENKESVKCHYKFSKTNTCTTGKSSLVEVLVGKMDSTSTVLWYCKKNLLLLVLVVQYN